MFTSARYMPLILEMHRSYAALLYLYLLHSPRRKTMKEEGRKSKWR